MNKIILLVGDSGCGKDFIMDVACEYDELEAVKRYISRSPRENEENSISSIFSTPIEEIQKMDYYYEGAEKGRWYGIKKDDLKRTLDNGKSPVVVCPNFDNYVQMNNDFPDMVVPFFIYRGIGEDYLQTWTESLIKRGSSLEEIEARTGVRDKYFKELYVNHFDIYSSNVILNPFGTSTKDDIKLQIEGLCVKNDINIKSDWYGNKSKR